MADRRFPVAFTGVSRAMAVLGMSRRNSYVDVDHHEVMVQMGWAFDATIPRRSVRSAVPDDRRVLGWGVHGWRGRWLVNGSSHGVVRVEIDPAVRARLTRVIPISLRELRVSVDQPDELIAAIRRDD